MNEVEKEKKNRVTYLVLSGIAIFSALFSSISYALVPIFPFLLVVLIFSFNPLFLASGVGLIIISGRYRVSAINMLVPFLGVVSVTAPPLMAGFLDRDNSAENMLVTGVCGNAAVLLALLTVTAVRLRRKSADAVL
ncbi:MAG: hypothetical protein HY751_08200 [Nitrospinae bacterium]|nr:hypothetical protein [Nitrospinota bacterium]